MVLIFSKIFNYAILCLNKARRKDEGLDDLCSCEWSRCHTKGEIYSGCRIEKPPPPGYKCYCYLAFLLTCNGRGQKCKSEQELGCDGCDDEECCSGNCLGYCPYKLANSTAHNH